MNKNYETFELTVTFMEDEDIVTTSCQDGVNMEWDENWNTGNWA